MTNDLQRRLLYVLYIHIWLTSGSTTGYSLMVVKPSIWPLGDNCYISDHDCGVKDIAHTVRDGPVKWQP